jgi:hypothetical protein
VRLPSHLRRDTRSVGEPDPSGLAHFFVESTIGDYGHAGVAVLLSADFDRNMPRPHQGFVRAFEPDWHAGIQPDLARGFLQSSTR